METSLPVPFPTTLHPSIKYLKGDVIPWKAATNKKDLRSAEIPDGWEQVENAPIVKLKPGKNGSSFNGTETPIYVVYLRKVA